MLQSLRFLALLLATTGFLVAHVTVSSAQDLLPCCDNQQCMDRPCDFICGWQGPNGDIPVYARYCVNNGRAERCKEEDGSWYLGCCCDTVVCVEEPGTICIPQPGQRCVYFDGEQYRYRPSCRITCGEYPCDPFLLRSNNVHHQWKYREGI